jgi:hypothetical protein
MDERYDMPATTAGRESAVRTVSGLRGRRLCNRESYGRLRRCAELQHERLRRCKIEFDDLMRRVAASLALKVFGRNESAVSGNINPKRHIGGDSICAGSLDLECRHSGVGIVGRSFFTGSYGESDLTLGCERQLIQAIRHYRGRRSKILARRQGYGRSTEQSMFFGNVPLEPGTGIGSERCCCAAGRSDQQERD